MRLSAMCAQRYRDEGNVKDSDTEGQGEDGRGKESEERGNGWSGRRGKKKISSEKKKNLHKP